MKLLGTSLMALTALSLSASAFAQDRLCVGESVVYTQGSTHYNAKIDQIYQDDTALIEFPNGEFSPSQISISTLSVALNVEAGFNVGESVVYSQSSTHYNAKIDELYQDGFALIEFPNGEFSPSQISINALSVALSSESNFTVGESVVYSQAGAHYNAQVLELYQDGFVLISFPNGEFSPSQISINTLSVALNTEAGFNVGETVVYTQGSTHYNAQVLELYQDGFALVSFPNGEFSPSQISINTLSVALYCTPNCNR
jgi:ribosomal protein L35AE/L33A